MESRPERVRCHGSPVKEESQRRHGGAHPSTLVKALSIVITPLELGPHWVLIRLIGMGAECVATDSICGPICKIIPTKVWMCQANLTWCYYWFNLSKSYFSESALQNNWIEIWLSLKVHYSKGRANHMNSTILVLSVITSHSEWLGWRFKLYISLKSGLMWVFPWERDTLSQDAVR